MNVRKRPRLELATAVTATAATTTATVAATSTIPPHAGTNGGGGLFLTSSIGSHLGAVDMNNGAAQIYLTICGDDDNSNESQEFYAIESIKQEPGDLDALHALLPTNLQLPTGCEIYLVKDTVASGTAVAVTGAAGAKLGEQMPPLPPSSMAATIKLEPDSILSSTMPSTNVLHFVGGNSNGTKSAHSLLVTAASKSSPVSAASTIAAAHPAVGATTSSTTSTSTPSAAAAAAAPAHHCTTAAAAGGYNVKMEAYKKRDDKRRATHNEVERRRRDKINCWIFKLKEMLPTEGNRYMPPTNPSPNANISAEPVDSKQTVRSSQNNGRTPPNDSKSQILIKACDYIKSMQNEIDSLRDCLREAESLRISNQALRDELENLKQQNELQERFNTAGGSLNVTLNSLNSLATSDLFDGIDTTPHLSTVSSINFTKRGLMIADYDE